MDIMICSVFICLTIRHMFRPVKGLRMPEEIASQIRDRILSGKLKPDERLPSEKELSEAFRASRASVREALRSLEATGLIVVRRGARGGPFVASMNTLDHVSETLSDALRLGSASMDELTEARLILEPALAELAARRASQQDLDEIKRTIETAHGMLGSGINPRLMNLEFHRAVARASKNSVLILPLNSTLDALAEVLGELNFTSEVKNQIASSHARIYKALERRDAKKAFALMDRHIRELHRKLWSVYINKLRRP